MRKNKKLKPLVPRWQSGGYKKKSQCDRCGFRARFTSQLLVYHVDGDLNNTALRNLRTVCRNCVEEIARTEITWRAGDLEPDA
jgi:ribosomal protein S14